MAHNFPRITWAKARSSHINSSVCNIKVQEIDTMSFTHYLNWLLVLDNSLPKKVWPHDHGFAGRYYKGKKETFPRDLIWHFTQVSCDEGAAGDHRPSRFPRLAPGDTFPVQNLRNLFTHCKQQDDKDKTVPWGELCPWAEQWGELISNNEAVSYSVCLQSRLIHEE